MKPRKLLLTVTTLAACLAGANGADWPNWRGPSFNGSTTETGLPTTFSKTESVQWVADLPGPSASTPAVWGDKVFVSTVDESTKTLWAMCLERTTGNTLWKHEVAAGISRDEKSNYSSPSPVTDGERVYFFYGSGELVAFDMAGKTVWSKNIQTEYGPFAFGWTFSTSPVLFDGRLYMQVLQRDTPANGRGKTDEPNLSYVLALDPKSGAELWRHIRPADAKAESLESFTTPTPFEHDGRKELLVAGGDCLTGHDPATGRELWRWGTWNPNRIGHWRLVPSPLGAGSVILACAPKGAPVYAVKAGLNGTQDDSALAWVSEDREISSDVATPLFYGGKVYLLNSDRKTLACLEPDSGKIVWSSELPTRTKLEASPLGADGKIYLMSMSGEVFVVKAGGDQFELLHETRMGDDGDRDLRSSIAAAHGQLFIRTGGKLYCLSK
jgi:outer membrane protein assembly factor BamB